MYRGSVSDSVHLKPYCQAEKRLHGSQYRPFDTGSCKADPNLERTTLQAKHTPSGGAPSLLSSSKVPSENLTSRMIGPAVVLSKNGQNIRVSLNFTSTLSTLRKKRSNTYQHLGMTRTCIAHGIHTVAGDQQDPAEHNRARQSNQSQQRASDHQSKKWSGITPTIDVLLCNTILILSSKTY